MTMIVEVVQTVLEAFTGLDDLVDGRIYPIILPQDVAYPALTSEKISGVPLTTLADSSAKGVVNYRMRVSSWANTLNEAQSVIDQVALAMKETAEFKAVLVFENDFHETENRIYRIVNDYSIWYKHT